MNKFIAGLVSLFILSCQDTSKNNSSSKVNNTISDLTDNTQKTYISLKLVDSVEKLSKEYDLYLNGTLYSSISPFIYDSVYTFNDYHDFTVEKKTPQKTIGNIDMCYSYQNGKCDKFIITHDETKIYGYNQSKGGTLQFTINNPFGAFDGFTRILYADTSVIFILDDNLYRQARTTNNTAPTEDVIYRYDLLQKQKTEFFRTSSVRPFGGLFNYSKFYITKIAGNRFLFACGAPSLDPKQTASLNAYIFLFETDLNHGTTVPIADASSRSLYQIADPYNSCLFQIAGTYKVPSNATSIDYSQSEDLEYVSIDVENGNILIQKNPPFFTTYGSQNINEIGNLYFLKTAGVYFVTKNFANFYMIPYKKSKTLFSHIIYLPSKNRYCYIEVDDNENEKIYIYEINIIGNF